MKRAEWFHGPSVSMIIDPMEPDNLRFRSFMLRAIALPSIINQSSQNFKWIILIEQDLDINILEELESETSAHDNIFLHSLLNDDLSNHDFLKQYIPDSTTHLVTTHLDDDDALPSDFAEGIRKLGEEAMASSDMPLVYFGTQNVMQWDMDFNASFPYGTYSRRWHRAHHKAASCGFSMVAKYPEVPLHILASSHSRVHQYGDLQNKIVRREHHTLWMRDQLAGILEKMHLRKSVSDLEFISFDDKISPVLMTNHGKNLQVNRVHEAKEEYLPVKKEQSFGSYTPDWDRIIANSEIFTNVPDWQALPTYRVPPWRRPNNQAFPKNILLYIKWHAEYFLRGKEYYYDKFYAIRFKRRPRHSKPGEG